MSGKSLDTFIYLVVVSRALESQKGSSQRCGPTLTLASYAGHLRVSTGVDDIAIRSMGHLLNIPRRILIIARRVPRYSHHDP